MRTVVQVVWVKKSFRLSDHVCLSQAAERGPVLPLCIVEPDYWALPDTSYRHYQFMRGCAAEFADELQTLGATLAVAVGSAVEVLQRLQAEFPQFELWSHQETGNAWTYERDKAVRQWCQQNKTPFYEPLQFGVWRGSKIDRDHWAKHWDELMAKPLAALPPEIAFAEHSFTADLPTAEDLGLADDGITALQTPGRKAGLAVLNSFLYERGEQYRTDMSSPVTGESGCSRISPHLTDGTLSMRAIYQTTEKRRAEVAMLPKTERGSWAGSLSSFVGRLHWHCHFTQKLELEPELEWLPMARSYKGVRNEGKNKSETEARLRAFEFGKTGYPFVDACLRYLRATGWINFRMRAMLMSFASYDLWLPWQQSGEVLARLFTDYEPGIHWPQTQMQSGVTGINAIRIYSPIKQGIDQDPEGIFTRQWVPEVAHLSDKLLQTPWLYDGEIDDYPPPIVEHRSAVAAAKSKIWAIKKTPEAKEEAEAVYKKHGSRKRPRGGSSARKRTAKKTAKTATKSTAKTVTKQASSKRGKAAAKSAKKTANRTTDKTTA